MENTHTILIDNHNKIIDIQNRKIERLEKKLRDKQTVITLLTNRVNRYGHMLGLKNNQRILNKYSNKELK